MAKRLTVNFENKPIYDIVYENSFEALADELKKFNSENRRVCVVTDTKVSSLYGETLIDSIKHVCREVFIYAFPNGEENKNLDTVKGIYEFLIQNKMDRKDLLIALGGGVVGDVTGFVAASYLRGVDFVQVPTTLLSQVDSSVGGKTGVDFNQYKNMVGAFKMPVLVYMNLSVLKTLDDIQFASGMGEVIKYGFIKGLDFYNWIKANKDKIKALDAATIEEMVYRSCDFKRMVVEVDPTEKGERALLNFGHTIGHAVEKAKNFELAHGECVAIGSVAATYISYKKGYISLEDYLMAKEDIKALNLPVSVKGINPEIVLDYISSDKKMEANKLKYISLRKIGDAFIDTSVSRDELLAGILEICEKEV